MPQINKPSDLNKVWSVSGVNTAPSDVKINNGFVVEIPPYQWFNYIENKQDQAIAHINQMGIPVWDSQTEYQAGKSQVQGSDGKIYRAFLTTTNVNPVGDSSGSWFDPNENGMVVISSVGTSTWTVPAILRSGFKKAKVTVQGGGGCGGTGTNFRRGGGGGAGGTAIAVMDLTGLTTVNVTVGSGPTGRSGTSVQGLSGGSSSFLTLNASGGAGGARYTTTNAPSGGFGGTASGGTLNIRGGDGSDGTTLRLSFDYEGGSADGGASHFGGGLRGGSGPGTVSAIQGAPGSGGGGGSDISQRGANGLILIEW